MASPIVQQVAEGVQTLTYTLTNADPTGDRAPWVQYADRSVQVFGTFGGASVAIEGSNDGDNWATLSDAQGNALAFSAAKIEQVLEVTRFVRPVLSGGAGSSVSVVMLVRRMQPARI